MLKIQVAQLSDFILFPFLRGMKPAYRVKRLNYYKPSPSECPNSGHLYITIFKHSDKKQVHGSPKKKTLTFVRVGRGQYNAAPNVILSLEALDKGKNIVH